MKIDRLRADKFYGIEINVDECNYESLSFIKSLTRIFNIDKTFSVLYNKDINRIEIIIVYHGWGEFEAEELVAITNYIRNFNSCDVSFNGVEIIIWGKDNKEKHPILCSDIEKMLSDK